MSELTDVNLSTVLKQITDKNEENTAFLQNLIKLIQQIRDLVDNLKNSATTVVTKIGNAAEELSATSNSDCEKQIEIFKNKINTIMREFKFTEGDIGGVTKSLEYIIKELEKKTGTTASSSGFLSSINPFSYGDGALAPEAGSGRDEGLAGAVRNNLTIDSNLNSLIEEVIVDINNFISSSSNGDLNTALSNARKLRDNNTGNPFMKKQLTNAYAILNGANFNNQPLDAKKRIAKNAQNEYIKIKSNPTIGGRRTTKRYKSKKRQNNKRKRRQTHKK